jgi:DNA repair protein RadD
MLEGIRQLRYYQEEAVNSLFDFFWTHPDPEENPIVALPTGTGKSIVIAEFIKRWLAGFTGARIVCATHVKELIQQNHLELVNLWPTAPAGIYSAGLKRRDLHLPISFVGIQSIVKCPEHLGWVDIIIIDECHLISPKDQTSYQRVIKALRARNPNLRVIGLTATPYRLQLGLLTEGGLFSHIVCDYTNYEKFNQLVDDGYICPLVPRRTDFEITAEGVGVQAGEYIQGQLERAIDIESITRAAIEESVRLAWGRRHWLVFCAGTHHADHTRDMLREMGIPAVSVHSEMDPPHHCYAYLASLGVPTTVTHDANFNLKSARDMNIAAFEQGYVGAMCNVNVLTTGWNFPALDCIIFLRPTLSAVLWVQALGRGTRPCPWTGKLNCLVLDFARNTQRLGPINDPVIPKPKGKKAKGAAPYKICPHCMTYNHARARFCIYCAAEFQNEFKGTTTADTAALIRRDQAEKENMESGVVSMHDVSRVEFSRHVSRDRSKPNSIKVTYYCGLRIFNEYLTLIHPSPWARKMARDKWRLMSGEREEDPPDTIEEALERVQTLTPPSRIRVLDMHKQSNVVGYDFEKVFTPSEHAPNMLYSDIGEDVAF